MSVSCQDLLVFYLFKKQKEWYIEWRMNEAPPFAPFLTLEYLKTADENKLFDRKSKNVKPASLAELISAFANADGGTIVIGISDNKEFEGIDSLPPERFNQLINAPKDFCRPTPVYTYELMDVTNKQGKKDHLLLLHIENESERIIQTQNESVYLRIGDRTKELKGEDLRLLEYNRGHRSYEDECVDDAELKDLDEELLGEFKRKLNAEHLADEQILRSRGLMKRKGKQWILTRGALLLFAREVMLFHPNCRVRFTRYHGTTRGVGTQINIIKDVNFDLPILKLIPTATQFLASQLKESTRLNPATGRFETNAEYPEFAWTEALINAIAHREYALEGAFIQVNIFDDRLEISSPGRLPNIVTIDNIQFTRFSRNPHIARVLVDFGWVRELNEGVKRIYAEMESSNLAAPRYAEPDRRYVMVTLMNQTAEIPVIDKPKMDGAWSDLSPLEQQILKLLRRKGKAKVQEIVQETGKARNTISKSLNRLIEKNLVAPVGIETSPARHYVLTHSD